MYKNKYTSIFGINHNKIEKKSYTIEIELT